MLYYLHNKLASWTTNPTRQSGIVRDILKEALDKYFDDYVENEVIFGDMMDILSARMSAAVNEVNKVMDLKDKFKNA